MVVLTCASSQEAVCPMFSAPLGIAVALPAAVGAAKVVCVCVSVCTDDTPETSVLILWTDKTHFKGDSSPPSISNS